MFGFFKKKADPKNEIYAEIKQLNFEDVDVIKSLVILDHHLGKSY